MRAAMTCFARNGYDATRIRDISRATKARRSHEGDRTEEVGRLRLTS